MTVDATDTAGTATVLEVTDAALDQILDLRAAEDEPDSLGLRVAVTGVAGADFAYDLSFEPTADAEPDDSVTTQGDLPVLIPADSIDSLRGAVLDLPAAEGQGGLVLRNPNKPDPLGLGDVELTGDIAEKVTQLLEGHINPSLAAHGGFASLVGVDGDTVRITMGGGCQGCAISAVTLREGIERAIREAIPEVAEVVDMTDHDAGENPYY